MLILNLRVKLFDNDFKLLPLEAPRSDLVGEGRRTIPVKLDICFDGHQIILI